MKPTASIIMPAFNRATMIGNAIKSVLAQTNPHWELLVIDDGSTDLTAKVVKGFGDPRIKYHYQDNAGPSAARNHALELAAGEWICYLDSDDEFLPTYLETMLEHFARHPKASFGFPKGHFYIELYQDGQRLVRRDKSDVYPDHATLQDIFHSRVEAYMDGFMYTRAITDAGIRFDPELPGLEDWDLMLQIGARYPDGFLYVPEFLFNYYQRYGLDGRFASGSYDRRARKLEAIYRKHHAAPLMQGQTWYPAQANHWLELEGQFQAGQLPPAYLYEFRDSWPSELLQPTA
ncbi:MAG TPA: glycosyltransferase family 2 protein [Candidatus Saccharimonadia bacterium]|jgi:glycosyltransferase involved in cell wall biosynthesis